MTRDEYELRRQRLDEQLRAGIELLQTAHRQQVRALDLVWATTAEEDFAIPQVEPRPAASPTVSPQPQPPAQPSRPRQQAGQLSNDVQAALSRLPEVFDRNHVVAELGYEPDRGSLFRTLRELIWNGVLSLETYGRGRLPSRYRKGSAVSTEAAS